MSDDYLLNRINQSDNFGSDDMSPFQSFSSYSSRMDQTPNRHAFRKHKECSVRFDNLVPFLVSSGIKELMGRFSTSFKQWSRLGTYHDVTGVRRRRSRTLLTTHSFQSEPSAVPDPLWRLRLLVHWFLTIFAVNHLTGVDHERSIRHR